MRELIKHTGTNAGYRDGISLRTGGTPGSNNSLNVTHGVGAAG